jgi:hypothetical protein
MKTRVLNRFIPSALFQRYPEKKLMTLLGATNLIRDELGEEPEALRLMRFEELWQVLLILVVLMNHSDPAAGASP